MRMKIIEPTSRRRVAVIAIICVATILNAQLPGVAALAAPSQPLRYMFTLPEHTAASAPESERSHFTCPRPIRPMTDMSGLFTFYKPGKTQSEIDRQAMADYNRRVWPTEEVKKRLTELANRAIHEPWNRAAIGHCIEWQLLSWADAGALLGSLEDNDAAGHRQAILISMWSGIAFANAYALLSQMGPVSDETKISMNQWLAKLADEIIAEFTPPTLPRRPEQDRWLDGNSNHRYWAGAAVGLIAAMLQDKRKFDWSMDVLRSALAAAENDGRLPRELKRGGRALHYQNFALFPLAILAVLADRNEVQPSKAEREKLAAIARFSAGTFVNPARLEGEVGYAQEKKPDMLMWVDILIPYLRQNDPKLARQLNALAGPFRPFSSSFVGLPVTALFFDEALGD